MLRTKESKDLASRLGIDLPELPLNDDSPIEYLLEICMAQMERIEAMENELKWHESMLENIT